MANQESKREVSTVTRIYWPKLSVDERAFVVAYVDNAYSVVEAASALKFATDRCRKMLARQDIKKAIHEVQQELDDIEFLNEKWVRAQLLKLYPMIIGEEEIPFINGNGEQCSGRKFHPDSALKVIEYLVPKKQEVKEEEEKVSVNIYLPDNSRDPKISVNSDVG